MIGLANARPDEPFDIREIEIHFDKRGAVRAATGPIVDKAGWNSGQARSAGEARVILAELETLQRSGYVAIERELHENGRTARVKARITPAGLDLLAELREHWHRAEGGS